jgi:hypothetical protein
MQRPVKDSVLTVIHRKLCEAFKTRFLPRKEFERELANHADQLLATLISLTREYFRLREANDQEVVKITKDDFILQQFNSYAYHGSPKYTAADLERLKAGAVWTNPNYQHHASTYESFLKEERSEVVVSLADYIKSKTLHLLSESQTPNPAPSVTELFWGYFHKHYSGNHWRPPETAIEPQGRVTAIRPDWWWKTPEIATDPQEVLDRFKFLSESNEYFELLDRAEQSIADVEAFGFELPVVNVGTMRYELSRSGWATTYYKVLDNDLIFHYTSSSKDEQVVEGDFVKIFIFQPAKKRLLKITISRQEVDQTYLIDRDFEKVSLKNDREILITKHHGNETIIFESRKDAKAFQEKILEMKQRIRERP